MSKHDQLAIGTVVQVSSITQRSDTEFRVAKKVAGWRRTIHSERVTPFVGVICGGRYICSGETPRPYGDYVQLTFFAEGPKTFVYLVRRGYVNKPVEVPEHDVRVLPRAAAEFHMKSFPMLYNEVMQDPEVRKALSEDAKEMKRDSKGRFIARTKSK